MYGLWLQGLELCATYVCIYRVYKHMGLKQFSKKTRGVGKSWKRLRARDIRVGVNRYHEPIFCELVVRASRTRYPLVVGCFRGGNLD